MYHELVCQHVLLFNTYMVVFLSAIHFGLFFFIFYVQDFLFLSFPPHSTIDVLCAEINLASNSMAYGLEWFCNGLSPTLARLHCAVCVYACLLACDNINFK